MCSGQTGLNWICSAYYYWQNILEKLSTLYVFFEASTDNEEQLQFPLELSSDPLASQPFSPAKGWLNGRTVNSLLFTDFDYYSPTVAVALNLYIHMLLIFYTT